MVTWVDYVSLVIGTATILALLTACLILRRLLTNQEEMMARGFESIESEIAEYAGREYRDAP